MKEFVKKLSELLTQTELFPQSDKKSEEFSPAESFFRSTTPAKC